MPLRGRFLWVRPVVPHSTHADVLWDSLSHGAVVTAGGASCVSQEKETPLVIDEQSSPCGRCSHHKCHQQDSDLFYVVIIVPLLILPCFCYIYIVSDIYIITNPRPVIFFGGGGDGPSLFIYVIVTVLGCRQ